MKDLVSPNNSVRSRQHIRWNREADLLGRLETDHQLELRGLLHGQISRFRTLDAARLIWNCSAADLYRLLKFPPDEGSAHATRRVHPQSGGGSGEHEGFDISEGTACRAPTLALFAFLTPLRAR